MTPVSLDEGQIFANRYRVLRCIASGGMGAVYEVLHLETERRRALKVMLPDVLQSERLRERFKREARVAAGIDSEFIVEVFDAGVDQTTKMPFLVMELLRGEELGALLGKKGPLPVADAVTLLHQVALALDKTHAARVVHRDLKPENLFVTRRDDGSPRIKILDFGISKILSESGSPAGSTRSVGTPLYMAPEQFAGRGVCAATDIWALGMIAYTLLVGDCYWVEESETADSVFAFATRVSFGPPERASSRAARLQRWLPPEFDAWFARATAVEPKARFQRATEATRALAEALGVGHLAPAPPAPVALAETAPGDEVASADPGVGESPEERPDADGPPEPAQAPVHDAMRERPGTWAAVVGIAVVGVSVVAVVTMVWIARGRARVAAASSAAASAPGVVELVPFTAPLGPGDPKAGVPGADRVPAGSSSVAAATAAASSIAPARSAAARGSAAKAPQTSAIPSAGGSAAQPPKQPKYTRD